MHGGCQVGPWPTASVAACLSQRHKQGLLVHLHQESRKPCFLGWHLLVGVTEVLNLGLRELAQAQQPLTWGDLIAEGLPYLRSCEGQLAARVVQELPATAQGK